MSANQREEKVGTKQYEVPPERLYDIEYGNPMKSWVLVYKVRDVLKVVKELSVDPTSTNYDLCRGFELCKQRLLKELQP